MFDILDNGQITGSGADRLGPFEIDGKITKNGFATFTKRMTGDRVWTIEYEGHFVNENFCEGLYYVGVAPGPFIIWK